MPEIERTHSTYLPSDVGIGIVHIGLGAFHRAHQAAYLESWLNRNGGGDWGICAANIRSNSALVEQLRAQAYRYHIVAFSDKEHLRITEVNAIRRALFAGPDKRELLDAMIAPSTKIVSLTVTEKGYYLSPSSGKLLLDDPDIAHDISYPTQPKTTPGLVAEAIRLRRAAGTAPFTVLSCDNMPANGERTRNAVCTLVAQNSAAFAEWIAAETSFPSTMVDRIVPAVTAERARQLQQLIGAPDSAAVACEAFSQWVIEDEFPLGRPDWEADGVAMVADVSGHETAKLRLLNGAHSLLAYVGLMKGLPTVAEAIADPALDRLVRQYFDEASASLDSPAGFDVEAYCSELLARFRNDALEHALSQIAMDGSQKIPQRWLEGAEICVADGLEVSATIQAVAAWMAYVRGGNDNGEKWAVDDPLARRLTDCHRQHTTSREIVNSLLDIRDVFSERLATDKDFSDAVHEAFTNIVDPNSNG